jgi:hypothetical protein
MKDWTGNINSIFKTLGASNHAGGERQCDDFYATDAKSLELFAPCFKIHNKVWECACGNGMLSKWLTKHGHDVLSTDLIDRGYGKANIDFLQVNKQTKFLETWGGNNTFDILTNPPYKFATQFVLHALDLIPDDGHVIMFLKTTFLEGKTRKKLIYDINPPRYMFQYSERILCAKNGIFRNYENSAVSYAMYVWNKRNDEMKTEIKWI